MTESSLWGAAHRLRRAPRAGVARCCPSMRTMGMVVAEVSQARQLAAWAWWRSFGGAEVAVLRCCTAPLDRLPGRDSMTAGACAIMSTWNRGRSNTSLRPTRREPGRMTCPRCSVESQTPSKAAARFRFRISSCIRRSLRTAFGRASRCTSTTPKTDPDFTRSALHFVRFLIRSLTAPVGTGKLLA
jgi:hypothetical protein